LMPQSDAAPGARGIEVAERLALRCRQIAVTRPAGAAEQAMNESSPAAGPMAQPRRDARKGAVERGARCEPGPDFEPQTFRPRPQSALDLLLAQLAHQIRQRNLHRTHNPALVAERRRVRQ